MSRLLLIFAFIFILIRSVLSSQLIVKWMTRYVQQRESTFNTVSP